jgi:hypothetical protein
MNVRRTNKKVWIAKVNAETFRLGTMIARLKPKEIDGD